MLLSIYSYGSNHIGSCKSGDIYLQATEEHLHNVERFSNFKEQEEFFYAELFNNGNFARAYITYKAGAQSTNPLRIIDLCEMNDDTLNDTLSLYSYPTIEQARPFFQPKKCIFACAYKSTDLLLYERFIHRFNYLFMLSAGVSKSIWVTKLYLYECKYHYLWIDEEAKINSTHSFMKLTTFRTFNVYGKRKNDGSRKWYRFRSLLYCDDTEFDNMVKKLSAN